MVLRRIMTLIKVHTQSIDYFNAKETLPRQFHTVLGFTEEGKYLGEVELTTKDRWVYAKVSPGYDYDSYVVDEEIGWWCALPTITV
jgi:hypothetical protein